MHPRIDSTWARPRDGLTAVRWALRRVTGAAAVPSTTARRADTRSWAAMAHNCAATATTHSVRSIHRGADPARTGGGRDEHRT